MEAYRKIQNSPGECFDLLATMATWVQEIGGAARQQEFEDRVGQVLKELDPRAQLVLEESGRGEPGHGGG